MSNWTDAYSGEISFLRAGNAQNAEGLDIAVMGIPYDLGTTGRPGARFGPRGVREQSLAVGEFDWGVHPWEYNVKERCKIADIGDVHGFTAYPDKLCPIVEAAASVVLEEGASLFSIGGDHFVSLPLLRAHAKKYGPIALIHFDAHSDTWIDEELNHGTMFYHAIQEGILDVDHSIQIGLRTPNPDSHGIEIIHAEELLDMKEADVAERIKARVGDSKAYLTFDIDFLDPAYAPATGTPVSGGPTTASARKILQGLVGVNIMGGDVVEVAPHYEGPAQITSVAAATVGADILYLLAEMRTR